MRVCPRCRSIYATKVQWCGLDNAQLVDQPNDPLIGTELERYRIVESLGIGGMGCVYRAKHTFIDRQYAIKVLFGEFAGDPKFQERFRREAKSISQIRHPNIVTVEDFGTTAEGLTFLAMEMVTGRTLEHSIEKEAPFSPVRAAQIIRQVVAALGAAHELGFVHRDVKPSNIMLSDREGIEFVKILDFGAVSLRSLPSDQRLTSVGHIIGTPTYMAPEQSQDPAVGPPADLYAVGAILYEMLTGSPPFVGKGRAEVLIKHIMEEPPAAPPSRGLEHLVAALLKKQPERRPQTARELINAIDELALDIAIVTDAPRLPQGAMPTTEIPGRRARKAFDASPARLSTPSTDPRAAATSSDPSVQSDVYESFPALDPGDSSDRWDAWDGAVPYADLAADDIGTTAKRHLPGSDDEFAASTRRESLPSRAHDEPSAGTLLDDLERDSGNITDPGSDAPPLADDLSLDRVVSANGNAARHGPIADPLQEQETSRAPRAGIQEGPTQIDFRAFSTDTTPTNVAQDELPTGDLDAGLIAPPSPGDGFDNEKTPILDQALTISDADQAQLNPSISDMDANETLPEPAPGIDSLAAATVELPAQKRPAPSPTVPVTPSQPEDFYEESEESLSMKAQVIPVVDTSQSNLPATRDSQPRLRTGQVIPWAVALILLIGVAVAALLLWGGHSRASESITVEAAARPEAPANRD